MGHIKFSLIGFLLLASVLSLQANNLVVSTPTLVGQDIATQTTFVQFDISWDNSWRLSTAPFNNDAVWVFVKYKVEGSSEWKHATLTTTVSDHSVNTENGVASEFKIGTTGGTGKGLFIQRAGNGSGSINWDRIKLKWDYGADGLSDGATVTAKVHAIEMVYIPQGNFSVGDGTTNNVVGQLHIANSTTTPFNITSERFIILGGITSWTLGNNNATGMEDPDDFNNSVWKWLRSAFPKGYDAFYIMKYEITQGQYVDFLNCLTRAQQDTRTQTNISGTSVTNRYVMSGTATMLGRNGIRCDADLGGTTDPINFYDDLDGDEIGNEADDGQHIACNFINWMDGAAYADWAGLRPFTELEYEKACRGTLAPVADEYAWGTEFAHLSSYFPLSNSGETGELPNSPGTGTAGNCAYGETTNNPTIGPLRTGIFATVSSDRINSGSSYYGVLEMSGNLWERIVTIGNSKGRSFTGTHGNGVLSSSGNGNNSDWPGYDGSEITGSLGEGFRGGSWDFGTTRARVSSRKYASYNSTSRDEADGMRLARSSN